jgi:hypothetical protein
MPRSKCDSDVTDVSGRRTRTGAPKLTLVDPPVWPLVGDLVQCTWTDERIIEGIVIEARDRGWKPPMITVLTKDGERIMWSSPSVRILARRRRPAGKKKNRRARTKR